MLTFIELTIVFICGLFLTSITSKEQQKSGMHSFVSLCLGCALLITIYLVALYISPLAQHTYTAIILIITISKTWSYTTKMKQTNGHGSK